MIALSITMSTERAVVMWGLVLMIIGMLVQARVVLNREDKVDVADQEDPDPDTVCLECAGSGVRVSVIAGLRIEVICSWCGGTGDSENYAGVVDDEDRAYDWARDARGDFGGAA